jgi:hypothetical protein
VQFGQIVDEKGYSDKKGAYLFVGFFLGILVYLLITALPDRAENYRNQQRHGEILNALKNTQPSGTPQKSSKSDDLPDL